MSPEQNPFPNDPDRRAIWDMLVHRDIDAFLAADWSMTEPDFLAAGFFGLNAGKSANPDSWRLGFPDLATYRDEWLRQAAETATTRYAEPLRAALFRATNLHFIEVSGERAVAHKKFDGTVAKADGGVDTLNWQTLYFCTMQTGEWKIASFVGYMPFPMGRGI
ncbi:hypothetical protein [Lichenihabitans psoromatis]|uniref:hypothetical protein n=1 Tax=Lichenihabitans psoromatis TaxID=2528642 RepID=UPI001038524E|nr:hypothetical protein [Lichenihabitans psoromatis]